MQRKTVAVAMIVKNEEAMLAQCLDSVKDKVDAIFIVDTGSQDRTVEIARKYTPHVFLDFVWTAHMADAFNHASSKVPKEYDFILSIDADEHLVSSREEIQEAIELAKDTVRVEMTAADGSNRFGFPRLFRNTPEIHWCNRIHKVLNIPGEGEPVGTVSIVYGHSPAHELDPDRSLLMLEQAVQEEEKPGRNLYYLGREYMYKGKYEEAVKTFDRYVSLDYYYREDELADAYLLLAQAHAALKNVDAMANSVIQAVKLNPNFKEAVEFMARIESDPSKGAQWRRMARYANNEGVLWKRTEVEKVKENVIAICPHNDDETLFLSYTLMRERPLVIICTDSYIQQERGEVGCDAWTRRQETIKAMGLINCPVVFLGIKDTELTAEILHKRLQAFNADKVYAPAVQGGNPQHDIVGDVGRDVFGSLCVHYTTYTKTELYTEGNIEIKPTEEEMQMHDKMVGCYQSQTRLPSTSQHFHAVRRRSQWLL